MDLLKSITGKNPAEFEQASEILVNTPDIELFKKLVTQDEFLFDFVKQNVSKRIKKAINKDNYINIFKFWDYYSPSYDEMFADVLLNFGGAELIPTVKEYFINGNESQKSYALKFLSFLENDNINDIIEKVREASESKNEYLSNNAIELLSKNNDKISKERAIKKLESNDEFEQYDGIKFLVTYKAQETLPLILNVMKTSSLAENIASEILFLTDIESLLEHNLDDGILVLCNIVNAIPEIIPPSATIDYNLLEIFKNLYYNNLTSSSALLLRMAKEKFESLLENEEYLYDCDKNTKEEVTSIKKFLDEVSTNKLNSLLYDELYEESDFVFFAVDYVNDIEELETLLDSTNQTLLLKVLTTLKEKQALNPSHKQLALNHITSENIKQIVEVL